MTHDETVLFQFGVIEENINHKLLGEYIRKHPHLARALLDLYDELMSP